jgi:hypothetical protein
VVNYYTDVVAALYTTQVGTAGADINYDGSCNITECASGSWQADQMRRATNTSIGMINSGSIGYALLSNRHHLHGRR